MSKKIGHDYNRDPYPWDSAKKGAAPTRWSCCDMSLPATYAICPICEHERMPAADALTAGESLVA